MVPSYAARMRALCSTRASLASLLLLAACCAEPATTAAVLDGAAFSDALTALIIAERGSFWAVDSSERRYSSVRELWEATEGGPTPGAAWRVKAAQYWASLPATLDSMVGANWEDASPLEVSFSRSFLNRLLAAQRALRRGGGAAHEGIRCLNVGAGIGREAVGVLLAEGCSSVDLLEPQAHFLDVARTAVPPQSLGKLFNVGVEDHRFGDDERYDVVWVEWASNYVSDRELALFFNRASAALKPGGALVIKDNVSAFADGVYSTGINHVIRSFAYIRAIAELGAPGLRVLSNEDQQPWVDGLFPMRAIAFVRSDEVEWAWSARETAWAADESARDAGSDVGDL
jgi:protein N-terminal methyltransferase